MDNAPPYASSLLQAARFNKSKVLEAHLTVLAGDERVAQVNKGASETLRNALMYASFHANLDSVELLLASDAIPQVCDSKGRTPLHYAAMNDN